MSFTAITTGEIASGESVKNTTATKIKDNFDDHETRIETLEGSLAVFPPLTFGISNRPQVKSQVLFTTSNFSFTITGVRILVGTAGSAGTLEIDLRKKRGGTTVTVFSTRPSVSYSSGDFALSSNAVLDSTPGVVDVQAGDILILDITSIQTAGKDFVVRVDYNR